MTLTLHPKYKTWYCSCGHPIKYLSLKQLDFLLALHYSGRLHQKLTGWQVPNLMSNEEFGASLKEELG